MLVINFRNILSSGQSLKLPERYHQITHNYALKIADKILAQQKLLVQHFNVLSE